MVTVSSFNRRRTSSPAGLRNGSATPRPGGSGTGGSGKRLAGRILSILAVLAILVGGGLWAGGVFSAPAEVRALRAAVDEQVARYDQIASGNGSFGDSGEGFRPMFESMRDMPEQYRDEIRSQMGRLFEARERAEVASFFAVPPEQRMDELDRRIQEEEARREARRSEWAQRQQSGNQGGGWGGPRGGGGPPAGGQGGPGGRGRGTEEQRTEWRKRRLDNTSPQGRAQGDEYRRLMRERREKLGLSGGRGR